MKKIVITLVMAIMVMVVVAPEAGAVTHHTISGKTWDCMGEYAEIAKGWYDGPAVTYGWWNYDDFGYKKSFTAYMELEIDGEVVEVPFAELTYNGFMRWLDEFDSDLTDQYYELYRGMSKIMGTWPW